MAEPKALGNECVLSLCAPNRSQLIAANDLDGLKSMATRSQPSLDGLKSIPTILAEPKALGNECVLSLCAPNRLQLIAANDLDGLKSMATRSQPSLDGLKSIPTILAEPKALGNEYLLSLSTYHLQLTTYNLK